jgi:transcriptional regulator with XRE-family HTH domain
MDDLPLGKRLRKVRRQKDLTQKELGELAQINPITISRLEHGNSDHVYARTVRDLARTLGVSADYLLGLTDEELSHA